MSNDIDIVERLRFLVSLNHESNGGPYAGYAAAMCMEAMRDAASTIEAMRAATGANLTKATDQNVKTIDKITA